MLRPILEHTRSYESRATVLGADVLLDTNISREFLVTALACLTSRGTRLFGFRTRLPTIHLLSPTPFKRPQPVVGGYDCSAGIFASLARRFSR